MLTLTYGLKQPEDGDQSSGDSGWFTALANNFIAIDAHTHNGVNSPVIDIANVSPLTTKGDLMVRSTSVSTRLPIGTDGHLLTADSTQTAGVKWAASPTAPDSSAELTNLSLAASVGSSALTISLKTKAGTDPSSGDSVKIGFRSSTAATGTYSQRTATAATSVVVSSGSTLGHKDAKSHFIYVYALDNSGTVELAVSSAFFDEGTRKSTTAEGGAGASDSQTAIYSTTARTNVPIRCIGRMRSTQTTAGTWAAVPTEISLQPFAYSEISDQSTLKVNFTPTNFGTVGGEDYVVRRVGDCMEVMATWTNGTGSAADGYLALPTGYTIDTSKFGGGGVVYMVGNGFVLDNGAGTLFNGNGRHFAVIYDGSLNSRVFISTSGASAAFVKTDGDQFSASDRMVMRFTIPITEWA